MTALHLKLNTKFIPCPAASCLAKKGIHGHVLHISRRLEDLLFISHDFVFSMPPVAISSLEIKSSHFVPALLTEITRRRYCFMVSDLLIVRPYLYAILRLTNNKSFN